MSLNDTNGFEKFCGGPVWNLNLTWYSDHPDFTECFQKTILVLCECGLFWIVSLFYTWYLVKRPTRTFQWRTTLFMVKITVSILLVMLCLINLITASVLYAQGVKDYTSAVISPLVQTITFMIVILTICLEQRRAFFTSGILFLFFLFLVITGIVPLYSYIYHSSQGTELYTFDMVTYVIYFALCLCQLIVFSFADQQLVILTDCVNLCPEIKSSFLSRITFSWINSLVIAGYKQPLTESSLWQPDISDKACVNAGLLEEAWKKELKRCHWSKTPQVSRNSSSFSVHNGVEDDDTACTERTPLLRNTASTSNETTPLLRNAESTSRVTTPLPNNCNDGDLPNVAVRSGLHKKEPSFLRVLFIVFGPLMSLGHICKLFADVFIFVGPMLQSLLVNYATTQSVETWKGYLYAILLFASAVLNTTLVQHMYQISYTVGIRAKSAIVTMVYKKALTLSNEARRTTTVGEIVNLMSVDAERLRDAGSYLWLLWSCPLQIAIAIFLLYKVLGVAVFAGLAIMVILFPVNLVLANMQSNLETKIMTLKDSRMKLMNELLTGMKVIKLYAWELSFQDQVNAIRANELKALKKFQYLSAVGAFSWTCAPFLVTLATFATYVMTGGILDANKAFTSLSLFNILRFPISVLPMMVSYVVTAWVSVKRINAFLQTTDLETGNVTVDPSSAHPIIINNGSFAWGTESNDAVALTNINVTVKDNSLVAIVGSVGSGKSSLLSAILGEMEKLKGHVSLRGSIAYVSQQAWIQNLTLRDNVLFGRPFDEQFYNKVIDACALRPDLDILPAGDMTEIGENGINLSGGQKQRVALARAVYQDSDVYLLDDPLSAVDSHVGKHLFDQVIGDQGLLGKKTRVLVTHGIQWLPKVDQIVVMLNGRVSEVGSYQDLLLHNKDFAKFLKTYLTQQDEDDPEIEQIKSELLIRISSIDDENDVETETCEPDSSHVSSPVVNRMRSTHSDHTNVKDVDNADEPDSAKDIAKNRLIEDEVGEAGQVKWSVYFSYCRALGVGSVVLILSLFALFEVASVLSSLWLTNWTDDRVLQNSSLANTTLFTSKRDYYLGVYGGFGALQAVLIIAYSLLMAYCCVRASFSLHASMLIAVLRAPLSFFDTTPIGRIMNRFSRDIDTVDTVLPGLLQEWALSAFNVLATVIILCYSTPIFTAVAVPLAFLYYFAQKFYIPTSRELRRLESKTRSPIYVHFNETITGATTVRAFAVQQRFIDLNNAKVDHNLVFFYASVAANRWLGLRLQLVGSLVVLASAILTVVGRGVISGSIVGLAISYSLEFTESLNWLVRMNSDLETNMVSVERLKEYMEVSSEATWNIDQTSPPINWPSSGAIKLDRFSTRYRPGLDLVLNGIDLDVKAGEKVGIVGRTGAGKSSLTLALFRIIESAEGKIYIDSIDVATLGLHQLRSRITILPQDPVMFSGSLRMNIDPFNQYSDEQIWRCLEQAHLKSFTMSLPAQLAHECGEGGRNFSVGQRQLVCLARALLRKTCILVLDEATAAVDVETDELIQATIRSEFADCTVLTIAHRLNTILDNDRIVVLDSGRVCEYDAPDVLLGDSGSVFYSMAKNAGLVS